MGPGEFAYLAGFDIDIINNNIIIYGFKRKFMYYDLDTYELISEKNLDISCCDFMALPQGKYAFFSYKWIWMFRETKKTTMY